MYSNNELNLWLAVQRSKADVNSINYKLMWYWTCVPTTSASGRVCMNTRWVDICKLIRKSVLYIRLTFCSVLRGCMRLLASSIYLRKAIRHHNRVFALYDGMCSENWRPNQRVRSFQRSNNLTSSLILHTWEIYGLDLFSQRGIVPVLTSVSSQYEDTVLALRLFLLKSCWGWQKSYLVDPASSHMLVSKIKPCMSKYKQLYTVKLRTAHYISNNLFDGSLLHG